MIGGKLASNLARGLSNRLPSPYWSGYDGPDMTRNELVCYTCHR